MPELFTIDKILLNAYRRKAITAYNRLEGSPRTNEFDRSLKAEVRDPLWMLTRQWQFAEFKGEDAASAMTTEISREHTVMNRISFPGKTLPYSDSIPLETIVERESRTVDLSLAVKLCMNFIRLMKWKSLYSPANIQKLRIKYPLAYPVNENDIPGQQLLLGVESYAFDGINVLKDINTVAGAGNVFSEWISSEGMPSGFMVVAVEFDKWYRRTYSMSSDEENAWLPSNLEYQFRIASAPEENQDQKVLTATQYSEGHLDWYSFDLDNTVRVPLDEETPTQSTAPNDLSFIPTPVQFPGMPNPRFWTMEDSKTDFGKLNTSPTGLLHLLFAEFGLVYSNDWFLLPYPVTSNTLIEVKSIVVTDVFGQRILVKPAGRSAASNWQRWTLFHHTDLNGKNNSSSFYMAPVIQHSLEANPLEKVNFVRDEMANLVWGVESTVPSQSGKGIPGKEMALDKRPFLPLPAAVEEQEVEDKPKIKYVLGTMPPHHWTPFIPVHINGSDTEIRLQRAKLPGTKGPFGNLLKEKAAPYFINEEEIGRSGVIVQRAWQYARWYNGKTFLWLGRYKQNGSGEVYGNLEFDQVVDI